MQEKLMPRVDLALLDDLSIGLVLLDQTGSVAWVNEAAAGYMGSQAAQLVDRPLAELPPAVRDLATGETDQFHDKDSAYWLRRETATGANGERLIVLLDRTNEESLAEENLRLRQQVEELRLTDELTGLPNQRAISQALDLHVSRSRRYQNPLSVVLVHVDLQPFSAVRPLSTDPVVLAVSHFLRDRLRWVDQISRWESQLFLLVLPETTEEDARGLLEKIVSEQTSLVLAEGYGDLRPTLDFGLACWSKGDDKRTLLRKALSSLRDSSGD